MTQRSLQQREIFRKEVMTSIMPTTPSSNSTSAPTYRQRWHWVPGDGTAIWGCEVHPFNCLEDDACGCGPERRIMDEFLVHSGTTLPWTQWLRRAQLRTVQSGFQKVQPCDRTYLILRFGSEVASITEITALEIYYNVGWCLGGWHRPREKHIARVRSNRTLKENAQRKLRPANMCLQTMSLPSL